MARRRDGYRATQVNAVADLHRVELGTPIAAKAAMKTMTLRTLMNERLGATIHCAMTGAKVRTLAINGDYCDLRAGDGTEVAIHIDTPLTYEQWFMDRGSVLVKSCDDGVIKLCTECDLLRYDDGTEVAIGSW